MKRVLILPFLFLLVSCSIFDSEPKEKITSENLVFQTDQTVYTANILEDLPPTFYGFSLIAHFENHTDQTIYLNRCDKDSSQPLYGLKLHVTDKSKTSEQGLVFVCVGQSYPITVKPGAIRTDTLSIRSPESWNYETNDHHGVFEGTFQLIYEAWTCKSGENCDLPDSLSQSNKFEVRLAD